jgi:hypothetical protein
MMSPNEIGTAPGRGRRVIAREDAEVRLSDLAGPQIHMPERAVMTEGPDACPACGASTVVWGCDPTATDLAMAKIHPAVWSEDAWMADSFLCRTCHGGWIEPDDPSPITWVRPYWRTED